MNENGSLMGIWMKYKFAIHPMNCEDDQESYKLGFQNLAMAFVTLLAAFISSFLLLLLERLWPKIRTRKHRPKAHRYRITVLDPERRN